LGVAQGLPPTRVPLIVSHCVLAALGEAGAEGGYGMGAHIERLDQLSVAPAFNGD
jgi:hypothetical protein